jgi:hypothetical protein
MTKRTLRHGVLIAIAAISASLAAPRIADHSLNVATAELAGPSSAIDSAIEHVARNVTQHAAASHLGFDTNIYPGDRAMDAWKRSGEYEWVGYYLQAPCHKDTSWSGARTRLSQSGWGLAVIYVGQQTWGRRFDPVTGAVTPTFTAAKRSKNSKSARKARHTRTMTRRTTKPVAAAGDNCSASLVNATQGSIDARDAVAKTAREGFPSGTVVFLDVEHMDVVPQPMRDYYVAWAKGVLADGRYRPGIYAHTKNAPAIYDDVSDAYDQAGVDADPPFWVAGSTGFSAERVPTDVGHAFASVWQGVLDVVRTHNGVKLPIDISVSSVSSPSRAAQ